MANTFKEQSFSVNNFNTPKVYEGKDATYILLVRLLLLEKGKNKKRPNMGVDIVRKWRYADTENIPNLKDEIQTQITTYLPTVMASSIDIYAEDKVLKVDITVDNIIYNFNIDNEQGLLQS